jgi:hypothetical protein
MALAAAEALSDGGSPNFAAILRGTAPFVKSSYYFLSAMLHTLSHS